MTTLIRLIVVLACYALSSTGILAMLFLILSSIAKWSMQGFPWAGSLFVITIVWIGAWVIHIRMSVAWISDSQLSRRWPLSGVVFGFASLAVWEVMAITGNAQRPPVPYASAIAALTQLAMVFPCFLLALWLVRFHWKRQPVCPG